MQMYRIIFKDGLLLRVLADNQMQAIYKACMEKSRNATDIDTIVRVID